jgi:putative ABC transport system permease protein
VVSVLDRKLIRELGGAKWMFLAITGIIVVGVLCFVEMRSLYNNLRMAKQDYYGQCRMADFWIDLKKAPVAELARLRSLVGIAELRPRIQFSATVDLPHVAKPLSGLVLTLPAQRRPVINGIVLRQGSYFTAARANEVIVGAAFAAARGLVPGMEIHLLVDNRRHTLRIVGTAISSEFVYLIRPGTIAPDPQHFGVFYVKHGFAEEIFDMDGAANQLVGLMVPASAARHEQLLARAERMLRPFGVLATTLRKDQSSNLSLSSEIEGLGVFATILPGIFLAVAALVLSVLMARLADSQRSVIGTLKAIGYSHRAVALHFLKFGLVVGTLGGLLGCLAGYAMADAMTSLYTKFFEFPQLENRAYPAVYLVGMGISVCCALAGSLRGAHRALRLQPAEAMRPRPPARGGQIALERVGAVWRRLSFPLRMALRNVVRNRTRTATGLLATAIGTSLLVVGFMSVEAMDFLVNFQFERILCSDFDLTFESERGVAALLEARRLPGVDYAEPILQVACTFANGPHRRKGAMTGLATDARLTRPRDLDGRPLRIPQTGLLMTGKMAELLHVSVGDLLRVTPIKGQQQPVTVPVAEIAASYLGTNVYANIDYLNHLVGEQLALTGVQLAVSPDPTIRQALYRQLKHMPALQAISSRTEMIDNLNQLMLETQNLSIAILVLFAGVISFGSILNASLVSLAERMREIATLRVIGYDPWQIGGLLLRESLLIDVLGTLAGLPLGYLLYLAMAHAYDMELIRLPVVAPRWVWIWAVVLDIAFGLTAHVVVQWKIHRTDWRAALQVNE